MRPINKVESKNFLGGRRQEAGGRRQEAGGRRQERQEAGGRRQEGRALRKAQKTSFSPAPLLPCFF